MSFQIQTTFLCFQFEYSSCDYKGKAEFTDIYSDREKDTKVNVSEQTIWNTNNYICLLISKLPHFFPNSCNVFVCISLENNAIIKLKQSIHTNINSNREKNNIVNAFWNTEFEYLNAIDMSVFEK